MPHYHKQQDTEVVLANLKPIAWLESQELLNQLDVLTFRSCDERGKTHKNRASCTKGEPTYHSGTLDNKFEQIRNLKSRSASKLRTPSLQNSAQDDFALRIGSKRKASFVGLSGKEGPALVYGACIQTLSHAPSRLGP